MMAETKVTVTTGTAHVNSDPGPQGAGRLPFSVNINYFRTTPGIIKLLQLDAAPGHNANAQQPPQQAAHVKTDPGQQGAPVFSLQRLNPNYFRTVPGIIKLVQLVLGIICMACASPAILSGTHWFLFVAAVSFTATLIWVFVYLLNIREALKLPINWILTELLNTALMTLLYLIAFIVQLAIWSEYYHSSWKASNIAAGVFGLFNFLAYAAGVYFLFVEWKNSKTGN